MFEASLAPRRLELVGPVHRLRLAALEPPSAGNYRWQPSAPLYAVRFTGPPARVDVDATRLRLRYGGLWPLAWFAARATDLALHPEVRWTLAVRGGLDRADLDLSRLQLDAAVVHGGLDRVTVRLPVPAGELPLDVRGGACRLRLVCPPGAALRVRLDGGADGLQIDTLRVGALGGRFAWETPGFAASPRRIDVRIRGGAQDLAVDWQSDPLALFELAHTVPLPHPAAWPRLPGGPR